MCQSELPELQTTLVLDEQGTPVVSIFGEIDFASLDVFESALSGAIYRAEYGCAVVDLRGTDFIDVLGMKVLLDAGDVLQEHSPGSRLLVVCEEQTRELIETVDIEGWLLLRADLPRADPVGADPVGEPFS